MKQINILWALVFTFTSTHTLANLEQPFAEPVQTVIAEWFSIDTQHDLQVQLSPLPDDELGQRAALNFISDDQQAVNGLVAWPAVDGDMNKLAFLLHPMGRDQNIWWSTENPIQGGAISQQLREQGYVVITLDARRHGERKINDIGLRTLLNRAHSKERRLYDDMIIGTVRDYRLALKWAQTQWPETETVVAVGYSMGAQMSLLLARFESAVHHVLAMVPPYVDQPNSPVAPRHHMPHIAAQSVTLFTANQDPYANDAQNQQLYDLLNSADKHRLPFDSGHLLPKSYLEQAMTVLRQFGAHSHE